MCFIKHLGTTTADNILAEGFYPGLSGYCTLKYGSKNYMKFTWQTSNSPVQLKVQNQTVNMLNA